MTGAAARSEPGARPFCAQAQACAALGVGHCRPCNMRRVIARPESWARRRAVFAARAAEGRRPAPIPRKPGPPPAPLPPDLARWVGWFLAAGWTPHQVAHLFGLGVRRVRRAGRDLHQPAVCGPGNA